MHDLKAVFMSKESNDWVKPGFNAPITDLLPHSTNIYGLLYVNIVVLFMWVVTYINGMTFKFMLRFWNDCILVISFLTIRK